VEKCYLYLEKRKPGERAVELLRSPGNQREVFTEQPVCRDVDAFLFLCCRNVISQLRTKAVSGAETERVIVALSSDSHTPAAAPQLEEAV